MDAQSQGTVTGLKHPGEIHPVVDFFDLEKLVLKRKVNDVHEIIYYAEILQEALPLHQRFGFNLLSHENPVMLKAKHKFAYLDEQEFQLA